MTSHKFNDVESAAAAIEYAAATNANAVVVEFNDAEDPNSSTPRSKASTPHSKVPILLSAILLLSIGTFLLFGAEKFNQLQRRQDMQQNLLRQIGESLREEREQKKLSSRSRRSAEASSAEEEEEPKEGERGGRGEAKRGEKGGEENIENVLERKDVIYVVSDAQRTTRKDAYEGFDTFPAALRSFKWRLSDETPSIPLNIAPPMRSRRVRRFHPASDARSDARSGANSSRNVDADSSSKKSTGSFAFDPEKGIVTVTQNGLYFLFSQLTFFTRTRRTQYSISVNDEQFATCKNEQQMASIEECKKQKGKKKESCLISKSVLNSCHTGGLRVLQKGDLVAISSRQNSQEAVVGPQLSFFGILKI